MRCCGFVGCFEWNIFIAPKKVKSTLSHRHAILYKSNIIAFNIKELITNVLNFDLGAVMIAKFYPAIIYIFDWLFNGLHTDSPASAKAFLGRFFLAASQAGATRWIFCDSTVTSPMNCRMPPASWSCFLSFPTGRVAVLLVWCATKIVRLYYCFRFAD